MKRPRNNISLASIEGEGRGEGDAPANQQP
jgi:hypothetical protein